MMETMILEITIKPGLFCSLEQGMGAHNIGGNKFIRSVDGSVHVGLSSKMDNRINFVILQQRLNKGLIQNITMDKFEF